MNYYSKYFLPFKVIVGMEIPFGIATNVMCLVYIIFKLKVDPTIKQILLANASSSIILLVYMAIGYVFVIIQEIRNTITCSLFIMPVTVAYACDAFMISTLSCIRYNMAYKASVGEIMDAPKLRTKLRILVLGLILCQIAILWLGAFGEVGFVPGFFLCYGGVQSLHGYWIMAVMEISMLATIYYDFVLARFIRNQSRVQPIQMAVWSVQPQRTSNSPNDVLSDSVPIKSTVLTSMAMVLLSVFATTVTFIDPYDQHGMIQAVIVVSMIRLGFHTVLTLVFTVKSQARNRIVPRVVPPPRNLQYYDRE